MSHLRSALLGSALLGLVVLLAAPAAPAQQRDNAFPRVSPNATVSQILGVTEVTIHYSRPSVRGRTIFGDLVPFGEVWRTGANEATAITFSTGVEVEGQPLAAGTYGLFTVPGEDRWTIVFNRVPDQWGAYQYDAAGDVLRVDVEPEEGPFTETMTFTFEGFEEEGGEHEMDVVLRWAGVEVAFEVEVDTDAVIRARAQEAAGAAAGWEAPYRHAAYALQVNRFLEDAAAWADASIAVEERFENVALKARLLAARGDYAGAVAAGERAVSLAEGMAEPPNGLDRLRQSLAEWRGQR